MNPIYSSLTALYYFTPGSIARTFLVNGEGFVYLADRKQERIREIIKGSDSLYNYIERSASANHPDLLLLSGVTSPANQDQVLAALAAEDKYVELLRILESDRVNVLSDPDLARVFTELEKLHKQLKGSKLLRYSKGLREFMAKYSPKAVMNRLVTSGLIRVLGKNVGAKVAGLLIGGTVALKSLARQGGRAIMHALAKVLGFSVGGPLGIIIATVATEIIYFIGQKLLKPVIKIGYAVIWAVGVIFLAAIISLFPFLGALTPISNPVGSKFDTAGNAAPIFCEQCGVGSYEPDPFTDPSPDPFTDPSPDPFTDPSSDPFTDPSPDPNAQCPLGPSNSRCSQGPGGNFSHKGRNAIDVPGPPPGYWYAPSDGVITRPPLWTYENPNVPGQLCGGIVYFRSKEDDVTHMIVHVVPYVQANQSVKKGEPIAKMALASDGNIHFIKASVNSNTCATAPHFHLELSGINVPADRYYRDNLNCNLGACP